METPFIEELNQDGLPVGLRMIADSIYDDGKGPIIRNKTDGTFWRLVMFNDVQSGAPRLGFEKVSLTAQPGETINP